MAIKMFGAYITEITSSVAWGGQGGSCQMTLVDDPDNDVNISLPEVGTPVGFRHGAFYFGGIFQRYTYKGSISGRLYDIIIESPAKLLDGIQIILDDFNGYVINDPAFPKSQEYDNPIKNIYNVYAKKESTGFGNSLVNSSGFQASTLLNTLVELINETPMVFGNTGYRLDISEIANAFNFTEYRIKGPTQSLASIITECCEAAGLDYFVFLDGTIKENNILNKPVIKIKTINRATLAGRGNVAKLVNDTSNIISGDIGEEFALPVTQKLVIGGPVSRWVPHEVYNSIPVWGKLSNGQFIYVGGQSTATAYNNKDTLIPVALDTYGGVSYTATLFELRMAMGGKDTWEIFKMFETATKRERNGFIFPDRSPWAAKIEITDLVFSFLAGGTFIASDAEPTSLPATQKRTNRDLQEQSDLIFSAVSKVASNFYGQTFLIPLKLDQDIRYVRDDIQYELAWDIADSAWSSDIRYDDISFYDGDGRMKGTAEWQPNPRYDFSALGSEWTFSSYGYVATTKGGAEKEVYYIDGTPFILAKSGAQIPYYDSLTTADFGFGVLVYLFYGRWIPPEEYLTSGGNNLHFSIPPAMTYPEIIGVPQQSNVYSWGPWWAWAGGAVAKSEIIMDESLKPETFGDQNILNVAGLSKAASGTGQAVPLETGTVQTTGVPAFNIADQIAGSSYITGVDIKADVSGETVTYKFSNWTPQFGRLSSANIDRIAKIYKGNLALAQRNRSQIEKRPLPKIKFEKSELDDLYKGRDNAQSESPVFVHSYMNEVLRGI